jgi:hypothetical protein
MSKEEYVQLEAVREALEKVVKDENAIEKILDLLSDATVKVDEATQQVEEPEAPDGDVEESDEPKIKKQYGILVCDKDGIINTDLVGWVFQMPEDEDPRDVIDLLKKAGYNYNASKKGRKYPVGSMAAIIENVGAKYMKPYNISIKTKEPVLLIRTDNVLPRS